MKLQKLLVLEAVHSREEIQKLNGELESAKAAHRQEVNGLIAQIEAKQIEIDRLRGLNDECGQKVAALTIEITTLKVEAAAAASNAVKSDEKAELLQKEKEGLIAEVATLKAQLGAKKK